MASMTVNTSAPDGSASGGGGTLLSDPPSSPPSPAPSDKLLLDNSKEVSTPVHLRRVTIQEPNGELPDNDIMSSPPDHTTRPKRSILKKGIISSPIRPPPQAATPAPQTAMSSPSARLAEDASSGHVNILAYKQEEVVNGAVRALVRNEHPQQNAEYYNSINSVMRGMKLEKRRIYVDIANSLCKCAKRDLVRAKSLSGTGEYQLVTIATKVVSLILVTPGLVRHIDLDLGRWFINNAMDILESDQASKGFVAAQIHLINWQKLDNPLTMENGQRLLTIVSKGSRFRSATVITEFVQAHRLVLRYTPNLMLTNISKWMPGILEAFQDRNYAIQLAATKVLSDLKMKYLGNSEIAKFMASWLKGKTTEEQTHFDQLCDFMKGKLKMTSNMELWATVFSLMLNWGNSPAELVDRSPQVDAWIKIAQDALFGPNIKLKVQAIENWNVVVYALSSRPLNQYTSKETKDQAIDLLLKPFDALTSFNSKDIAEQLRQLFVIILQAFLRGSQQPQKPHVVTSVWDSIIINVLKKFHKVKELGVLEPVVLQLLSSRSNSSSGMMNRADILKLPSNAQVENTQPLGAKWVKCNSDRVLELFIMYFDSNQWGEKNKVWAAFMALIKTAVGREVRISNDTMECMAETCNFVDYCWNSTVEFKPVAQMIMSMVESFDNQLLLERPLTLSNNNKVIYSNTASLSRRSSYNFDSSQHSNVYGALYHLWRIMQKFPAGMESSETSKSYYEKMLLEYFRYVVRDMDKKKMVQFSCNLLTMTDNSVLWKPLFESMKSVDEFDPADTVKVLCHFAEKQLTGEQALAAWPLWTQLFVSTCKVCESDGMFKPSGVLQAVTKSLSDMHPHPIAMLFFAQELILCYVNSKDDSIGPLFQDSQKKLGEDVIGLVGRAFDAMPQLREYAENKRDYHSKFILQISEVFDNDEIKQALYAEIMPKLPAIIRTSSLINGLVKQLIKKCISEYCPVPKDDTHYGPLFVMLQSQQVLCACFESDLLVEEAIGWWNNACRGPNGGCEFSAELIEMVTKVKSRSGTGAKIRIPRNFTEAKKRLESAAASNAAQEPDVTSDVNKPAEDKEPPLTDIGNRVAESQQDDDTQLVKSMQDKQKKTEVSVSDSVEEQVSIENVQPENSSNLQLDGSNLQPKDGNVQLDDDNDSAATEIEVSDSEEGKEESKSQSRPQAESSESESDGNNQEWFDSQEHQLRPVSSLPNSFSQRVDGVASAPRPRHIFQWFTESTGSSNGTTGKIQKEDTRKASLVRHPSNSKNILKQALSELDEKEHEPEQSASKSEPSSAVQSPSKVTSIVKSVWKFSRSFLGDGDTNSSNAAVDSPRKQDSDEGETCSSGAATPVLNASESNINSSRKRKRKRKDRSAAKKRKSSSPQPPGDQVDDLLSKLEAQIPSMTKQQQFELETKLLGMTWKLRKAQIET